MGEIRDMFVTKLESNNRLGVIIHNGKTEIFTDYVYSRKVNRYLNIEEFTMEIINSEKEVKND